MPDNTPDGERLGEGEFRLDLLQTFLPEGGDVVGIHNGLGRHGNSE